MQKIVDVSSAKRWKFEPTCKKDSWLKTLFFKLPTFFPSFRFSSTWAKQKLSFYCTTLHFVGWTLLGCHSGQIRKFSVFRTEKKFKIVSLSNTRTLNTLKGLSCGECTLVWFLWPTLLSKCLWNSVHLLLLRPCSLLKKTGSLIRKVEKKSLGRLLGRETAWWAIHQRHRQFSFVNLKVLLGPQLVHSCFYSSCQNLI